MCYAVLNCIKKVFEKKKSQKCMIVFSMDSADVKNSPGIKLAAGL